MPGNKHPAVMFEVMSNNPEQARAFYSTVFGWTFDTGSAGFSYVQFPSAERPLLGGIGQADPAVPGMRTGTNFYLLVDDLVETLKRAVDAGASVLMRPTKVDGYHFAMFTDPEGLSIGLITKFE